MSFADSTVHHHRPSKASVVSRNSDANPWVRHFPTHAARKAGFPPAGDTLASSFDASKDPDWSSYTFEYLIRRVLQRQHEVIRQQLLQLKQETAGAEPDGDSAALENSGFRLRSQIRSLIETLLADMAEEERIFPDLLHLEQAYVGEKPGYAQHIKSALAHLSQQNDRHLERLDALRHEVAARRASPDDARRSQLCLQLGALQTMLLTHLHLEHDIIFPRAACMEAELFRYRQ